MRQNDVQIGRIIRAPRITRQNKHETRSTLLCNLSSSYEARWRQGEQRVRLRAGPGGGWGGWGILKFHELFCSNFPCNFFHGLFSAKSLAGSFFALGKEFRKPMHGFFFWATRCAWTFFFLAKISLPLIFFCTSVLFNYLIKRLLVSSNDALQSFNL